MNAKIDKSDFVSDIKILIEQSKHQLALVVNSTMSLLYWQIGTRIKTKYK